MEQPVPDGLHPVEGAHAGAVGEEVEPMEKTHTGEIHGGLFPVGVTPDRSRGRSDRDKVSLD